MIRHRSRRAVNLSRKLVAAGFSLLELTVTVVLVATLTLIAFVSYFDYSEQARLVAVQRDFRLLREALRVYDEDHFQSPYELTDPNGLFGRYLSKLPEDPWFGDYVIDPFLGRLISKGPDGVLNTEVPGLSSPAVLGGASDDLVEFYAPQGLLALVSDQSARVFLLDGVSPGVEVFGDAGAFGAGADRDTAALFRGGAIHLVTELLGDPRPVQVTPWTTSLLELAVSADNRRFAALDQDRNQLFSGPLIAGSNAGDVFEVYRAATGVTLAGPSWGRDQQELAVATSTGEVWRIAVGQGASPTVLTSDAAKDVERNAPSWSADGKLIAYAGSSTGQIRVTTATGGRSGSAVVDVSSVAGSPGPVALSPDGRKIAFVSDSDLWIVDRRRPDLLKFNVTRDSSLKADSARSLVWR